MTALAGLAKRLGADVLHPLGPVDDREVSTVVMAEAEDAAVVPAGALVLAAGVGAADPRLADALDRWGAAGACAAVVKARGATQAELAAAGRRAADAGMLLLAAPDDLPWLHLLGLVSTVREHGRDEATRDERIGTALGDLFGLATAIAAATGGATAIEDPGRRVLAYSTVPGQQIDEARKLGILGRQVPHYPSNDFEYRRLYRSRGVMRLESSGETLGRLAVAVRSGSELLGSIWTIDAGSLSADAEAVLLDASRLAALHLLRARSSGDVERQARGESFRMLLDGRQTPALAGGRLGFAADATCQLVAFALPSGAEEVDELILERLHELVALRCAGLSARNATTVAGGAVWVLLVGSSREQVAALVEGLAARAGETLGVSPRVAVGEPGLQLAAVPAARRELDNILRLLDRPGETRTRAGRREMQASLVLLEVAQLLVASPALVLDAVTAVIGSDRSQGGRYGETLLAYLDCFGDVAAAAERISIHPNTFRYRLRRARELFGIDLDDPQGRLVLWLQLKVATL